MYVFYVFFKIQKKHDFLRFFELLHTFSRTLAVSVAKLGAARKLGADPAAPATVPAHGQNGVCGLWHHPLARSFAVFSAILPSPDILYVSKNLEHFRFF